MRSCNNYVGSLLVFFVNIITWNSFNLVSCLTKLHDISWLIFISDSDIYLLRLFLEFPRYVATPYRAPMTFQTPTHHTPTCVSAE